MKKKITYSQVGDNYNTKDPVNLLSQQAASKTKNGLESAGFGEVSQTRGESAFVWRQGNVYMAAVTECLGTKCLIADAMREVTGKTYYDVIAHDTVATGVNDLTTVGAKPLVVNAYWSISDNGWLQDKERIKDFINGWKDACLVSGATWGGGETSTNKGIIKENTVDLAVCVVGIVKPQRRLLTEENIRVNDKILLLRSNGINANGVSLARAIASKLPKKYATKLPSGKLYGNALLQKTNIYAEVVRELFEKGIDLHYIANITGHGLRKVMRAKQPFMYMLEHIFPADELFLFMQKHAELSDYEMYQTFNMGMDYALFLPEKHLKKALEIVRKNHFEGIHAGYVKKGDRQVVILPKKIVYTSETLRLKQ